ncbi:histidine kinase, partial [Streptomyces rubrogriseus]|nr:histidine kinase [Streptomyces rubrogriseus]
LGTAPSTHFRGPVDARVPDRVADRLLTALREALAAASARPDVSRVEVTVETPAPSPEGRDGVRLRVADDGTDAGGGERGTTVTWWAPL